MGVQAQPEAQGLDLLFFLVLKYPFFAIPYEHKFCRKHGPDFSEVLTEPLACSGGRAMQIVPEHRPDQETSLSHQTLP